MKTMEALEVIANNYRRVDSIIRSCGGTSDRGSRENGKGSRPQLQRLRQERYCEGDRVRGHPGGVEGPHPRAE